MRSFDDTANIKGKRESNIPDFPLAVTGLNGVKAPYGVKQQCEIQERLLNAGVLKQQGCTLVRK